MIYHYFLIFALLFVSSEETNQTRSCGVGMTFSDALPVQYWLAECDTFNESVFDGVNNRCWCQPWQCSDLMVSQFQDTPGLDYEIDVIDQSGNILLNGAFTEIADGVYQHSYTPNQEGICDEVIQQRVTRNGTMIARTDCISVKTLQKESKLLQYSNHRNLAGLVFTAQSPDPSFYIRIPCRFVHEQFPQEDKAIELTSSVITTASQSKKQKKLEVLHSPYYFHYKLMEILQCQSLTMANTTWKKEEAYAIDEGSKRSILKSATCWLTRKNSVVRNVI
jgi:hypothetical protein